MLNVTTLTLLASLLAFTPAAEHTAPAPDAPAVLTAEADGPQWEAYGQALSKAQESGKKVIVDVYTDWCGWCKKMDKNVYARKSVRDYIAKHYIAVKLDAESKSSHSVKGEKLTEKDIARAYGVRSFPTTLFLSPDGDAITAVPGYIEADKFVLVLKYINEEHYKDTKWEDYVAQNG